MAMFKYSIFLFLSTAAFVVAADNSTDLAQDQAGSGGVPDDDSGSGDSGLSIVNTTAAADTTAAVVITESDAQPTTSVVDATTPVADVTTLVKDVTTPVVDVTTPVVDVTTPVVGVTTEIPFSTIDSNLEDVQDGDHKVTRMAIIGSVIGVVVVGLVILAFVKCRKKSSFRRLGDDSGMGYAGWHDQSEKAYSNPSYGGTVA